jgi:hypothetical protein
MIVGCGLVLYSVHGFGPGGGMVGGTWKRVFFLGGGKIPSV